MSWWWTEPRRAEAWRVLVEQFHAAQSDVRIQEVPVPAPEYARTLFGQAATGGLQADTVTFSDEIAVRLVRGKLLDALDGTVERLGSATSWTRRPRPSSRRMGGRTGCWRASTHRRWSTTASCTRRYLSSMSKGYADSMHY